MSNIKEFKDAVAAAVDAAYEQGVHDERERLFGVFNSGITTLPKTKVLPAKSPTSKVRFSLAGTATTNKDLDDKNRLTHFGARKKRRHYGNRREAAATILEKLTPGKVFHKRDVATWVRPISTATGMRGLEDLIEQGRAERLDRGTFRATGHKPTFGGVVAASTPAE